MGLIMENEKDIAIQIEGLKKMYRLGTIGGGTLVGDLQSWWARKRGKEDPNSKIGAKVYGKNETFMALDGIDLTIHKGERIGIIGHNGAGKSTLLKLLSRVTGPTEGVIKIDGRISSMLEVGTGFNGELTGRENIYLNGAILGMTKAEVDSKMEDIIEFSEVRQFIDTPVKRYSSGMYVKLAFSVAAHLDSEILIMDEVLAVGDMAFQKKCLDKMSQVSKDEGRTILYVSHNMNTIRQLCDRCIVLDHGKIVFNGDVEDAISIYLGVNDDELPVHYDLNNADRPYKHLGKKIHITSFDFLDKSVAIYKAGEKICFKVDFTANEDIPELKMYFTIISNSSQVVGTTQILKPFCNAVKNTNYSYCFEMCFPELVNGKYSFNIDIFSDNGKNRHLSYDHPTKDVVFEIIDDSTNGFQWHKKYHGYYRLQQIKLLSNENICN